MADPLLCAHGNSNSGCTKPASHEKPLCYAHWQEFDRHEIAECARCHRFDDWVGALDLDICYECFDRERRGFPLAPVHVHAPIGRRFRYLYILKLDGGTYYVGQTNDLELRLGEHRDGQTRSTAGKGPRLVWFQEWVGEARELNAEEARLTKLALDNPRAIRRMVAEWQWPLKLVTLEP